MSESFSYSLNFFGSLLALLLAAGQLVITQKTKSNYFYALTFISISLWSGSAGLFYFFPVLKNPGIFHIVDIISRTAYSFTVVLLYFLMQSVFQTNFTIRKREQLLLLPGIATFIILASTCIFFNSRYLNVKFYITFASYLFSICIYVFIIYQIYIIRKYSENEKSRSAILKIMLFLSISAILTIIPELAPVNIKDIYSVLVLIIFFYLMTMRYPQIFILLREEAQKVQYTRSKINNLDIELIKKNLEHKLKEEKLFLESDLTLKDLSNDIGITPHQLSEILNVYYKQSFYDFINHFRIEEAKKIFASDNTATALGICFHVGFNSNSAFYRAFKKETGISPGSYRKKI